MKLIDSWELNPKHYQLHWESKINSPHRDYEFEIYQASMEVLNSKHPMCTNVTNKNAYKISLILMGRKEQRSRVFSTMPSDSELLK